MAKRSTSKRARPTAAPLAKLAPSAALVGDAMPPRRNRYGQGKSTKDEAFVADLRSVNGMLAEAATGRTGRLIDFCKSTKIRDPRQGAVCATRILALGRPWVVTPPPGYEKDPEGIRIADRVRRILAETPGFGKLIGHLGHGVLEGHAVAEHDWRKNARGEVVSIPQWRHPNRFGWNTETEQLCRCEPGVDAFPGIPLADWPGKFLVHAPTAGVSDYPWLRGVQRMRAIASVLKRSATRWGLKGLERFGQPQLYIQDNGDTDETMDAAMDAMQALSSNWIARFPQGMDPKAIAADMSETLHLNWVQFFATEDAIAILGQNLTTEVQGGSFAAAEAHRHVRLDILASDLAELAETLIDQWIRLIVQYNWPGAPVPVLDFILAPKGEITVEKFKAGLYTYNQVRAADGQDPIENGDRFYVEPGIAPIPMFPVSAPTLPSVAPAIDTEPTDEAVPTEAAPTTDVAASGLNGAQIKELKQLVLDIASGLFPRASAESFIGAAFPGLTAAQIAGMLPPIGFTPSAPVTEPALAAAPPGGAVAAPPFSETTPKRATATGTSPTSSRSTHPLATSLSQR